MCLNHHLHVWAAHHSGDGCTCINIALGFSSSLYPGNYYSLCGSWKWPLPTVMWSPKEDKSLFVSMQCLEIPVAMQIKHQQQTEWLAGSVKKPYESAPFSNREIEHLMMNIFTSHWSWRGSRRLLIPWVRSPTHGLIIGFRLSGWCWHQPTSYTMQIKMAFLRQVIN